MTEKSAASSAGLELGTSGSPGRLALTVVKYTIASYVLPKQSTVRSVEHNCVKVASLPFLFSNGEDGCVVLLQLKLEL